MDELDFEYTLKIKCGKRKNEWIITINGNEHSIYFVKKKKLKDTKLYVDNNEVKIPSTYVTKHRCIDYPVEIEGETIRCVCNKNMVDIAVHGKYVNSQGNYYPERILLYAEIVIIIVEMASLILLFCGLDESIAKIGIYGPVFAYLIICGYLSLFWKEK